MNATPSKSTSSRFSDFRHRKTVDGTDATLPLFGYDFFQPARELIEARRAALRRRYGRSTRASGLHTGKPIKSSRANKKQTDLPDETIRASDIKTKADRGSAVDPESSGMREQWMEGQPRDPQGKDTASDGLERGTDPEKTDAQDKQYSSDSKDRDRSSEETTGSDVSDPGTDRDASAEAGNTTGNSGQQTRMQKNDEASAGQMAADGEGEPHPAPDSLDAFNQVADPLTQLYRNISASVPVNYPISAGDTLTIRFWSARHEMKTLTRIVDSQGSVSLPDAGMVVVRSLTLDQTEKALRAQLRRFYNGVDVSVTLGRLRTIQVLVSGQAFQPGSYTVPAVTTAYNLVYAAGGPTRSGSLRNIEVRRGGHLIGTLDIYKYMMVGGQASDIPLQSGDLLYIPPHRSRVAVRGEVLQPAYFEMRDSETLHEALTYAGGIKASGVDQRIQINTVDPGARRILKDIDLKNKAASATHLYDGDRVEVFSVRPLISNQVTVEGAVDQPSDYALETGMRVSDLLKQARGLLPDAYLTHADLVRTNLDNTTTLITLNLQQALDHATKDDLALQPWDRLKVYSRQEVTWTGKRSVSVRGSIAHPGVYNYSDGMHVSALLRMAGGPLPDAFLRRAVLLHQHGDGAFDLDYINLADAGLSASAQDPLLQDNDLLAVYRNGEAEFQPEHLVSIRGAVVAPGPYPRTEGMHLSDLLRLAGGFVPGASDRVTVAHARQMAEGKDGALQSSSVLFDAAHRCAARDDMPLEDGDVISVQGSGRYQELVQVVYVQGAVVHPGPVILTHRSMRMTDALRQAGGLLPEAFPQGAEFVRDSRKLLTSGQRDLTRTIGQLNDLLNESAYNREKGKSYIERIKAINGADRGDTPALPIGNSAAPAPSSAVADKVATQLAQQDMVSPPRSLKGADLLPDGSIAIDLPGALERPNGQDDLILVDGDTITVPERPTTVQVIGAVFHARSVLFQPRWKLEDYIAQAGGFAPDAANDRIKIIHVGGGLIPATKQSRLQPGDVLLVPTRVLAEKLTSHQNAFDGFFHSLTSSALIFKVATSLFGF